MPPIVIDDHAREAARSASHSRASDGRARRDAGHAAHRYFSRIGSRWAKLEAIIVSAALLKMEKIAARLQQALADDRVARWRVWSDRCH
jgi:hypothetical protein